jgi:hypothetical protein
MSLLGLYTAQARPSVTADGNNVKGRAGQYGDLFTIPILNPLQSCAAEGSYFKACNTTPGTGIAQSIITSYTATSPILTLYNGGTKQIIPDYIRLINSVAGATTTSSDLVIATDEINRFSSGGTLLTANNVLSGSSIASAAVIYFGAITALTASIPKIVGRAKLKVAAAPCWIIYDQVIMTFGQAPMAAVTNRTATTATDIPTSLGPVVINPGHSLVVYIYNTANATTAPSWEIEMGYVER